MVKLPDNDKLHSTFLSTAGVFSKPQKSPEDGLGELFEDVQSKRIYQDSKTFADLVPKHRMSRIKQEYRLSKNDPNFDLRDFVSRHFYVFESDDAPYRTDSDVSISQHIETLWSVLERKQRASKGSLVGLPNPYIVPGGRFDEQFYWDSYFIMLGLAESGRWKMIEGMIKNYTYMIRKFGFIPTANRTYFLSRSQPPFFSHMVNLLASHKGQHVLLEYLPYILMEYRFWMKGRSKLSQTTYKAFARVAEMSNGTMLNRYYDNKNTPRPESHHEDVLTASQSPKRQTDRLFLHLRAGAESGWDFSSRWFDDPNDIKTIHTADIIPIDLNCLLFDLEKTISRAYQISKQKILARRFEDASKRRAEAIFEYCWNEDKQFFYDYNFHKAEQTSRATLAALSPLFSGLATQQQADAVAKKVKQDFLKSGGLVSTQIDNGQQWDAPNGWAPLHWIAIQGLRNYGHNELADEIKNRWVSTNQKLFEKEAKLVEKYNVMDLTKSAGGGEYVLQDGFGWTNGVLLALLSDEKIA